MCKLSEILLGGYGFLTKEYVKELKEIMGGRFKVVARTYEHGRLLVSINELENLNPEIEEDIRDVFIDIESYNILKKLMGIN